MSAITLLQVALDAVAVVCLGWLVWDLSGSRMATAGTIAVYSLSSFVSVFNNAAMMDSLGTATLVFAVVIMHLSLTRLAFDVNIILICGLLICWTVFLRQVHGVILPVFMFLVLVSRSASFAKRMSAIAVICLPIALAIGFWATRNYSEHNKFVPLISSYRDGHAHAAFKESLYQFIKGMGGDIQEWAGESAWFLRSSQAEFPFSERVFTRVCGLSEMQLLRADINLAYELREKGTLDQTLEASIEQRCDEFLSVYKSEHPYDYWICNRLRLLFRFLVQKRLDNLPFPKKEAMNTFEFSFKGLQLLLLSATTLVGFVAAFCNLFVHQRFFVTALVPLAIVIVHPCILGFIEQRYLCSVHPLLVANFFVAIAAFCQIGVDKP